MNLKKILCLLILAIFTAPFLIISAQSRKVVQTPETKPTPILDTEVAPSKQTDAKLISVTGDSVDKYKLVYVSVYDGKLRFSVKEKIEMMKTRSSIFKNFSDQLNKLGQENYKIISALPSKFVAIAAPDETQHEYELFETESSYFFVISGLEEKLKEMSERGFRIVDYSLSNAFCEPIDSNNPAMGENCNYVYQFLFEKETGVNKPLKQIIVSAIPGWNVKPSEVLEKQIDEKLAEGFYPTNIFSKFEILLEKAKDKNDLLSNKLDVQIVRSSLKDTKDKINDLAKQGYRLALTNDGIALMYRNAETAQNPVSYIWLKTASTNLSLKSKANKNLEKDLANLQAKGGIYKTAYPNAQGSKNTLIFEQKLKDDGKRAEFKILKFEFDVKENQTEGKVYVDLTPSSKEAVRTMNALAKEGFQVRDLFYSDKVSVILERVQ